MKTVKVTEIRYFTEDAGAKGFIKMGCMMQTNTAGLAGFTFKIVTNDDFESNKQYLKDSIFSACLNSILQQVSNTVDIQVAGAKVIDLED